MEKQLEYDLRKQIGDHVSERVESALDRYWNKFSSKVGFLFQYPLNALEESFQRLQGGPEGVWDREVVSWFLKQMMLRGSFPQQFEFDPQEFSEFKDTLYPKLSNLYRDTQFIEQLQLMRSVNKIQIREEGPDLYSLHRPMIMDSYDSEKLYYLGLDDESQINLEVQARTKVNAYFTKKLELERKAFIRRLNGLTTNVDKELLNISINSIALDIEKAGSKFNSSVFGNAQQTIKIVSLLHYFSVVQFYKNLHNGFQNSKDPHNRLVTLDYSWLLKKITKETRVEPTAVAEVIDYFLLNPSYKGTLAEFPLVRNNNSIVFIPSSFMLNDWHFSLINGHYYKEKLLIRRNESVSESIVNRIADKAGEFTNIEVIKNKAYSFTHGSTSINSEIDIALFDKDSGTLLVIECKWKENVYDLGPKYKELEDAVNKIYKNQLDRHHLYLTSNPQHVSDLFNQQVSSHQIINQEFIIVDKRVQYHTESQHMVSLYILLAVFREFEKGSQLPLDKIVQRIASLRTEVIVDYVDANTVHSVSESVWIKVDSDLLQLSDVVW